MTTDGYISQTRVALALVARYHYILVQMKNNDYMANFLLSGGKIGRDSILADCLPIIMRYIKIPLDIQQEVYKDIFKD